MQPWLCFKLPQVVLELNGNNLEQIAVFLVIQVLEGNLMLLLSKCLKETMNGFSKEGTPS